MKIKNPKHRAMTLFCPLSLITRINRITRTLGKGRQAVKRIFPGSRQGVTVMEVLVTTSLLALVICLGVPSFVSLAAGIEVNKSLGTVTSALNTARSEALQNNYRVKVQLENNRLVLKKMIHSKWQAFRDFDPGENVTLSMNASPVFSPEGYTAPLCSILIKSSNACYKVSIAITGRLSVVQL